MALARSHPDLGARRPKLMYETVEYFSKDDRVSDETFCGVVGPRRACESEMTFSMNWVTEERDYRHQALHMLLT